MAHRGLRKPSSRRSLRPRNHSVPPRTAAEGSSLRDRHERHETTDRNERQAPRRASSAPSQSGPAPRSDRELENEREATEYEDQSEAPEAFSGRSAEPAALQPFDRPATPPPANAPGSEHALHDHDDPLADAFFRHPDKPVIDVWEEDHAPVVHTMSRGSRRAMFASIGIFALSIIGISAYSIYQNWIMPAPAELGATAGDLPAVLPTPVHPPSPPSAAARETQLAAATNPAPTPAPAASTAPTAAMPEPAPAPTPAPPSETLAAIAARPAIADPSGKPPVVEGTTGQHLRASADETARAAEQLRVREAGSSPTGAITGALGGSADPQPPQEAPARTFVATAGAPTYEELVEVGRNLSKRNRRVEASEAFRRALLKSPQGSAALSGLSYVYLNAEENQTARAYAQRAVQSDATNAEGWIVLGAALEMLGDKAGAQDAYRNCVQQGKGPYLLECRRVMR